MANGRKIEYEEITLRLPRKQIKALKARVKDRKDLTVSTVVKNLLRYSGVRYK